jgi:hypothetical protein
MHETLPKGHESKAFHARDAPLHKACNCVEFPENHRPFGKSKAILWKALGARGRRFKSGHPDYV